MTLFKESKEEESEETRKVLVDPVQLRERKP